MQCVVFTRPSWEMFRKHFGVTDWCLVYDAAKNCCLQILKRLNGRREKSNGCVLKHHFINTKYCFFTVLLEEREIF